MRWSARLAMVLTLGLAASALPALPAVASTAVPAAPHVPATSSQVSADLDEDLIAYVCQEPGRSAICTIKPDGTDRKVLTGPELGSTFSPTWSPDGSKIAFSAGSGLLVSADNWVWVMGADGSDPRRVTQGSLPDWSPTLTEPSFEFDASESFSPSSIDSHEWEFGDGSGSRSRRTTHTYDGAPTEPVTLRVVAADGSTSTQTKDIAVPPNGAVAPEVNVTVRQVGDRTLELDASNSVDGGGGSVATIEWFFDSAPTSARGAVVTHTFPGSGESMFTVRVTDTNGMRTQLTRSTGFAYVATGMAPTSARIKIGVDGAPIAAVRSAGLDDSRATEIYTFGLDGRRPNERYLGHGIQEEPAWTPDGASLVASSRKLTYTDLNQSDLFSIPAEGLAESANLTKTYTRGNLVSEIAPAVSPSGERIAYVECVPLGSQGRCTFDTTRITVAQLGPDGVGDATPLVPPKGAWQTEPAWNRDGTELVYADFAGEATEEPGGLWLMAPDGSDRRRIPNTKPRDRSPDWRPPLVDGTPPIRLVHSGQIRSLFAFGETIDARFRDDLVYEGLTACIQKLGDGDCLFGTKERVPDDLVATTRLLSFKLQPGRYEVVVFDDDETVAVASKPFRITCQGRCDGDLPKTATKTAAAKYAFGMAQACPAIVMSVNGLVVMHMTARAAAQGTLVGTLGAAIAVDILVNSLAQTMLEPLVGGYLSGVPFTVQNSQIDAVADATAGRVGERGTTGRIQPISTSPLDWLVTGINALCLGSVSKAEAIAADPPDPDFAIVSQPGLSGVQTSAIEPADRIAQAMSLSNVYGDVVLTALERLQGAELARDQSAAIRQLDALTAFVDGYAESFAQLGDAVSDFIGGFEQDAVLATAPLSRTDLAALRSTQEQVRADGFDGALLAAYRAAGLSDAQILALENEFKTAVLSDDLAEKSLSEMLEAVESTARTAANEFEAITTELAIYRASMYPVPVTGDQAVEVSKNSSVFVELVAEDPEGAVLDYEILSGPSHGRVIGEAPNLEYRPDPDYLGPDSITWVASNDLGTSPPATVSIQVLLPAPTAVADGYGTEVSAALQVPAPGVLTNDLAMAIPITAELVQPPAKGSVALRSDGSFTYTPRPTASGTDRFTYRARTPGSAASAPATVTITLVNANRPPTAVTDLLEIDEDTVGTVDVLANDRDLDGDPLTFTGVRQPRHGAVVCVAAVCTYSPARDFNGSDRFTYTVSDGQGTTSTGTVLVTVRPVQDPPTARDDLVSIEPGAPVVVDVLANDSDPDGDPVTFVDHTDPAQGTATCTAAGVCTYTPVDETVSADEFTYTVTDGKGNRSQASVLVANEPPMIFSDGPLQLIITGNTLSCSVDYLGDTVGSFFNDVGCGTFLATGGTLYGQTFTGVGLNPPQPREFYEPLNQSRVLGAGTVDDPYRVVTRVRAGESGLELVQTDSYVVGEESYRTDVEIANPGTAPATAVLYRGGDCNLGDSDTGFGRRDPTTGAVACTAADGRILEWLPLSPGSTNVETDPDTFWDAIASQQPFPDTCRCAEDIDNAGGLSWQVTVPPGGSVVRSHRTIFSPFGYRPLLTTMSATPPQTAPAGEVTYTITITNPNETSPAQLSTITARLPDGFGVVAGSTSGITTTGPSVAGATLTWTGPFSVPADGQIQLQFRATASIEPGTYRARAGATAENFTVQGTGDTAPVEVLDVLAPFAFFDAAGPDLTLAFDGTSSFDFDGTIVSYAWDFGDGGTGAGPTPNHTYASAGQFPVTLTVTDDDGATGSVTRTVRTRAPNLVPTAAFTSSSTELRARLDGRGSADPDGTIVAYGWDFGDGTTGWGPLPVHDYPADGPYTVTLMVTDDRGGVASTTRTVTVTRPPNQPPVAAFTSSPSGLTVDFDGRLSFDPDDAQGTITAYSWSFGDGATATGPTPGHVYASDGVYPVTLTVTDRRGATASTTRDVRVAVARTSNAPPEPVIVPVVDGLVVDVDSAGSQDPDGEIVSYEWEFADQGVVEGPTANFAFLAPGRYPVRLTVTDDDGASAATVVALTVPDDVEPPVNEPPTAAFSATPTFLTVAFDGSGSADPDGTIVSHAWQFGDGATGTGATPVHVYAAAGTYPVTLTVTDDDGATATRTTPVTVASPPAGNDPPTAAFTTTVDDLTVDFDATSSTDDDGTVVSYQWSFGDGATGTGSAPTHVYAAAGTYTVTLVVTDDDGASDVASEPVTVTAPPVPPVAAFLADPTGLTVTFDGSSSVDADGTIVSWQWAFGDGSTGTGADTVHAYAAAGTYQVTLTVTDDDGLTDSTSAPVTVVAPRPGNQLPVALFTAVEDGLTVVVDGSSSTDPDGTVVTWRWDFGDGTTANGSRVTHTFPSSGTRAITLQVVDDDGGVDSVVVPVTVVAAPDQLLGPTAVIGTTVTGKDVSFHGAESFDTDGTIVSYEWDLGDGSSAAGANPTHRYELPGDYAITLTVVDDDGLIGSTVSTITVAASPPTPGAPVAAFDARIADGRVTFDGSMSLDVDGEIVEWAWTFGDGSEGPDRIGPGSVVSHRYGRNGTFTAVLSVVAADGGTASTSRTVTIAGVAEMPVVAPPTPPAPAPVAVTPQGGALAPEVLGDDLPRTGSDPWRLARWGLLFLLIGWLALLGRRGLLLWRR